MDPQVKVLIRCCQNQMNKPIALMKFVYQNCHPYYRKYSIWVLNYIL